MVKRMQVQGLGFGVWGLGFGVWGLGFAWVVIVFQFEDEKLFGATLEQISSFGQVCRRLFNCSTHKLSQFKIHSDPSLATTTHPIPYPHTLHAHL